MAKVDMILKELRRSDAYPSNENDFNISPLTYNGEIIEVTWPQVTDIKKSEIYKSNGLLHLQTSESLKPIGRTLWLWHDFELQQQNTWGWVMWSVLVTWPDLTRNIFLAKTCAMNVPTKSESFSLLAPAVWRWDKKDLRVGLLKPPPGIGLKGVCLLHLLSENIFPVLRSNWFYVLMKQKWIWNLSLCYFSLFCFYLTGYDGRTAERKSDSTWRTWCKQTLRVYHSRRPISWLILEMQYPVIYIIKFSNN